MIKSIKPDVIIPSRITIQRNCLQKYNDLKEKIIIEMNNLNSKVSLTTDIWTSISQQPYVSTTAHYFHNKELQHLLLDFSLIPYPHKGEDIKIKVQEVIQEFGLLDKIIAITTDNASNNIKEIQELQLWLNENYNTPENIHLRCFAHIINLSVKHGLDSINMLKTLRSLINFIKNSPKRLQHLGEISRVLQLKPLKPKVTYGDKNLDFFYLIITFRLQVRYE
jgi:hypothetical protein